ncbi:MAG: transporter [Acidobacteria bacterium]|nr:transporter [Acidobacteriota bacterium]
MPKLIALLIFRALLMLLSGVAVIAQQRPLITEDVEVVKPGSVRLEFGFDFAQRKRFPVSGLQGDLSRLGVASMTFGLAPNVEVEVGGVIHNSLAISRRETSAIPLDLKNINSTSDVGDFFIATKIKVRNETNRTPAIGLRFGVQLPNSNQARGIGLNQTNFFMTALASKTVGKFRVSGNLGLSILTAPTQLFTQNDVMMYGLSVVYPLNDRVSLLGEVNGRMNTRKTAPLGTESDGEARFGARFKASGLLWDVSALTGLHKNSIKSGVSFGLTYESSLFTPAK